MRKDFRVDCELEYEDPIVRVISVDEKSVQGRLLKLRRNKHYQNDDVWRSAVVTFAARCALRVYPFYVNRFSLDKGKEITSAEVAVYAVLLASQQKYNDLARNVCLRTANAAISDAGAYTDYSAHVVASSAYVADVAAHADTAVSAAAAAYAYATATADATADAAYVVAINSANKLDLIRLEECAPIFNDPLYQSESKLKEVQKFREKHKKSFQRFEGWIEEAPDLIKYRKFVLDWCRAYPELLRDPKLSKELEGATDDDVFPLDLWRSAEKGITNYGGTDVNYSGADVNYSGADVNYSGADVNYSGADVNYGGADARGTGDSATAEDNLGYKKLTVPMAKYLSNAQTHTPMTLSVEGEWGCGKSSFMKMLRDDLPVKGDSSNSKIVWFNPWGYKEGDEQWSALIASFVDGVEEGSKWKKYGNRFLYLLFSLKEGAWKRVSVLVSPLVVGLIAVYFRKEAWDWSKEIWAAGEGMQVLAIVMALGGYFFVFYKSFRAYLSALKADAAKVGAVKDMMRKSSEVKRFSSLFHAFLRSHLKWKKDDKRKLVCKDRVYVFIDDLDRCAAPKAADLLDSIQLLLTDLSMDDDKDCPVVFILGIDREKVAAGVAVKHERVLPYLNTGVKEESRLESGRLFGYDYLQKFIDIPFHIPRPGRSEIGRLIDRLAPIREESTVTLNHGDTRKSSEVAKQEPLNVELSEEDIVSSGLVNKGKKSQDLDEKSQREIFESEDIRKALIRVS